MNNVCLVGRLTKDPELRHTANDTAVCNFTLAVDRRFKSEGQPKADFINIVAWSKFAEFVGKYFVKGLQVSVVGRIQTRSWEGEDGKRRYATEVVAEQLGFADAKRDNQPSGQQEEEIDDSDIPF
ncbi:MAG: single-stranded DNA-binding protein [Methanofastidiosum sp.]